MGRNERVNQALTKISFQRTSAAIDRISSFPFSLLVPFLIRHRLVNRTLSNRISTLVSFEESSSRKRERSSNESFCWEVFFCSSLFLQDWLADKHLDELIIDRPKFWREKRSSVVRERIASCLKSRCVISFYYPWQKEKEKYVVFVHEVYEVASGVGDEVRVIHGWRFENYRVSLSKRARALYFRDP